MLRHRGEKMARRQNSAHNRNRIAQNELLLSFGIPSEHLSAGVHPGFQILFFYRFFIAFPSWVANSGDAGVNEMPGASQSRGVTEPQRDRWTAELTYEDVSPLPRA